MTLESCNWAQMKAWDMLIVLGGSNLELEVTVSKEDSVAVGKKVYIWAPNLTNWIKQEKNLFNKKVLTGN